jgi:hypothetical protein
MKNLPSIKVLCATIIMSLLVSGIMLAAMDGMLAATVAPHSQIYAINR